MSYSVNISPNILVEQETCFFEVKRNRPKRIFIISVFFALYLLIGIKQVIVDARINIFPMARCCCYLTSFLE